MSAGAFEERAAAAAGHAVATLFQEKRHDVLEHAARERFLGVDAPPMAVVYWRRELSIAEAQRLISLTAEFNDDDGCELVPRAPGGTARQQSAAAAFPSVPVFATLPPPAPVPAASGEQNPLPPASDVPHPRPATPEREQAPLACRAQPPPAINTNGAIIVLSDDDEDREQPPVEDLDVIFIGTTYPTDASLPGGAPPRATACWTGLLLHGTRYCFFSHAVDM